jgi:hypothetical protein
MADQAGVDLLLLDDRATRDGLNDWHDPGVWYRPKQARRPPRQCMVTLSDA